MTMAIKAMDPTTIRMTGMVTLTTTTMTNHRMTVAGRKTSGAVPPRQDGKTPVGGLGLRKRVSMLTTAMTVAKARNRGNEQKRRQRKRVCPFRYVFSLTRILLPACAQLSCTAYPKVGQ